MNPHLVTAAALAMALAAAPAWAQAKNAGAGKSTSEIRKSFAKEREAAVKALQEKELAALKAHAKTATGDEKESALAAAQDLASTLEKWADAKALGEEYLAAFASSDGAADVKLATATAVHRSGGKLADALKLFDEVADSAGDNKQMVFSAYMQAVDAQLEAGDSKGALASLDKLEKALSGIPQVGQIVMNRRAEVSALGTAPKEFESEGEDGKKSPVNDANGQPLSLAQYKGKVVLLDFWATWCGPCREELPNVIATYEKYKDKGFEVVGISLDEDEEEFRKVIAEENMSWRHHFDGKGWANEIAQLYGVQSIPATYLLGRDGKIARIGLRGEALGRAVEKLLAEKPAGN
jgi:thiol-disulfide isomerase/thioredoxin